MMVAQRLFLILITIVFYSNSSYAVLDLVVREKIEVFKENDDNSKVVTTLNRGDRVVISPKKYDGWYKVLVTYDGERKPGYIFIEDMELSVIIDRDKKKTNLLQTNRSVGIRVAGSYSYEAGRELQLADFPETKIDTVSGFNSFFGIHYSHPVGSEKLIQVYYQKRSYNLKGAATFATGNDPKEIVIKQEANSLGANIRFYSKKSSIFWWGAGAEYIKVSGQSFTSENVELSNNLPTESFINVQLEMGWDFSVTDFYFITAGLRIGGIINSSPNRYSAETILSVSRLF